MFGLESDISPHFRLTEYGDLLRLA
jgi:hypothetical protein